LLILCLGIVGEVDEEDVYIWTHKKFDIGYNKKHIVDVNLTSEDKVKLQPKLKIPFTYEVTSFIRTEFFSRHEAWILEAM
jgi:transmembrane 9 superfamily member 3